MFCTIPVTVNNYCSSLQCSSELFFFLSFISFVCFWPLMLQTAKWQSRNFHALVKSSSSRIWLKRMCCISILYNSSMKAICLCALKKQHDTWLFSVFGSLHVCSFLSHATDLWSVAWSSSLCWRCHCCGKAVVFATCKCCLDPAPASCFMQPVVIAEGLTVSFKELISLSDLCRRDIMTRSLVTTTSPLRLLKRFSFSFQHYFGCISFCPFLLRFGLKKTNNLYSVCK